MPHAAHAVTLDLPTGSTAADAVAAAGLPPAEKIGIYGRAVESDTRLSDGDRVEVYRVLAVDPKEARRRRARKKP